MSADEDLRAMAANRGCKLVTSRVRTPGKSGYGKFALKDAGGKAVFGLTGGKPAASAEEIETFLRGGATTDWRRSLGNTKPRAPQPAEKPEAKPKAAPVPPPEPKLVIRAARSGDAAAITALIVALGYEVEADDVRRRMAALTKAGQSVLVAEKGELVGVLTTGMTPVLHRPKPVGRISMLVVAEVARGAGIGRALVAAAEERLREAGCGMVEVTSNVKRLRAHAFYRKLGYERTSYRFARTLDG